MRARAAVQPRYAWLTLTKGGQAVAVKQVRVSDLSGRQATEEQFAKLIVHEHPQYQGPITLDVLPEELGELPDSDQYVSIEVIGPGDRSGQRALLLSVDRFNQLAAGGDMNAILMDAVAAQRHNAQLSRVGVPSGQRRPSPRPGQRGVGAAPSRADLTRGGRLVAGAPDEVQRLRSERGVPLLDTADPKTKALQPVTLRPTGHQFARARLGLLLLCTPIVGSDMVRNPRMTLSTLRVLAVSAC